MSQKTTQNIITYSSSFNKDDDDDDEEGGKGFLRDA